IHKGEVVSGTIAKGDIVTLQVDHTKRDDTARNHTATHILHFALRKVIGDHVKQAGSLVAPDRLRFDFTHFSQTEPEMLEEIEKLVNDRIRENIPVQTVEMEAEEAFKSDAIALFEERYGDRVRMVSLNDFSKELCGGTHTGHTGDIGLFKIIEESSVAAGIRRIEAVTGSAAVAVVQKNASLIQDAARMLKENPEVILQRIKKILTNQKMLEKELEQLKTKIASLAAEREEEEIKLIDGTRVLTKRVEVDTPAALRNLADRFRDKIKSGIVALGSLADAKVLLIVVVTKDLTDRYHAGNIVKQIAPVVGGSGGGRPDMAQAGGNQPEHLDKALDKVAEVVETMK
ncbi:MAG: alanine--tRNA ligase, partial [Desulfobacterales bacterium]